MRRRPTPVTSPRKEPRQARSAQLVADILKAAVRVLEREGAARFTTIRVAAAAGVSVGSLYQYFPNKQAILYRLQVEEWHATGSMIDALLGDETKSVDARLHAVTRAFFRSECEEAQLRSALDAAAPSYHEAPESKMHRERGRKVVDAFIAEASPRATPRRRRIAAELVLMAITAIGKQVSERRAEAADVDRLARETADMLGGYLAHLGVA